MVIITYVARMCRSDLEVAGCSNNRARLVIDESRMTLDKTTDSTLE